MFPVQSAAQPTPAARHEAAPASRVGALRPVPAPAAGTPELSISGCTAQHRGDRDEQQDRVALLGGLNASRCALGVLADGMGGMSGGALAADNVVTATRRRFEGFHPDNETPEHFFRTVVDEVHTMEARWS